VIVDLPLFPLPTVLFPGGVLPLRIFEQRYMDMVKQCLREASPFGVCLIKEGSELGAPAVPEKIGCLAHIKDWDMPQLGVLHIRTEGGQRFFVHAHQARASGLVVARIETLPAEPETPPSPAYSECAAVLRKIIEKAGERYFPQPLRYADGAWVSYRLAEVLPLDPQAKQKMLEMSSTELRLQVVHRLLQQQGLLS
jgi:uncharacterized protein